MVVVVVVVVVLGGKVGCCCPWALVVVVVVVAKPTRKSINLCWLQPPVEVVLHKKEASLRCDGILYLYLYSSSSNDKNNNDNDRRMLVLKVLRILFLVMMIMAGDSTSGSCILAATAASIQNTVRCCVILLSSLFMDCGLFSEKKKGWGLKKSFLIDNRNNKKTHM